MINIVVPSISRLTYFSILLFFMLNPTSLILRIMHTYCKLDENIQIQYKINSDATTGNFETKKKDWEKNLLITQNANKTFR